MSEQRATDITSRELDVIVIGAGPAGEIVAGRLATKGNKRVAIVEDHLVGGECSFYACMPSKALLRPQEILDEVARVPGAATAVNDHVDVEATLDRRDAIINQLRDDHQVPWLKQRKIELIRGHGRLAGERQVIVDGQMLTAREAVVVAVGSGALMPPIPGLEQARPWTNREITTTREIPRRLLVLGGGVVGVEMAQAWRSLGSEVAIVEALDQLLPREEPFVSDELRDASAERGIDVYLGARATAAGRSGDEVTLELDNGTRLTGSHLLVALGRHAHTDDLGLNSVGLTPGRHIEVDDQLRVPGNQWLYAVGDVNGRSLLTHAGKYQARIAADAILGEPATAISDRPGSRRVVFTDPQVAAVGLTLAQALEAGIAAEAIDVPTGGTAGASFYGRGAPGTSRFVVDVEHEVLLGATFVGPEVADFLQAATIAIVAEVSLATLAHAIAPFPTRSELWLKFLEAYEAEHNTTLHATPALAAV